MSVTLKWKKLDPAAQLPQEATAGAACFDLRACLKESVFVKRNEVSAIPTALSVEIPQGFEMQLRARSGLAFKHGLTLVNGVGTIDSDYRGELKVLVTLLADELLEIKHGDRIAQALVSPVLQVRHEEVSDLGDTVRGEGGFGSTGVSC